MNQFIFAGKSSKNFKIRIEKCPVIHTGQRAIEKITVPGRSGDLIFDTGAFANYTQPYEIYFNAKCIGSARGAAQIANWLLLPRGYQRLDDTYSPETYRMASYIGPMEVENWMLTFGRATIEFDCKPQRFLKSGEFPIKIQSGQSLYNAWQPALPLIQITGTGDGQLVVGKSTVNITGMAGNLMLDSEVQNAYDGTTNKNNSISISGGFPVLEHGESLISYSGGITAVNITPRWWML